MQELHLFDENYQIVSHAKRNDPATSFHAAKVALKSSKRIKQAVLDIFSDVSPDGLIDEELQEIARERGLNPETARKRRSDLSGEGRLVWNGKYRNAQSGCKARVWHKG